MMTLVSNKVIKEVYNFGRIYFPTLVNDFHQNYEILLKLYYKDIHNIVL